MTNKSLWPSFGDVPAIKTPKIILQEQAAFLEKESNKYIISEVITTIGLNSSNKLTHVLRITAPKIENYTAAIVQLDHDSIKLYPTTLISRIKPMPVTYTINNEQELLDMLKKVFEEKETLETIKSLFAQTKAIEAFAATK